MPTSLWVGRAKLCSSASGCGLGYNRPTCVHSGAQAEGTMAPQCELLPAAQWNAGGQAWRCKCIFSLCLHHITNIPLSKAEHIAKPQVKKSSTRNEFGPISQPMMYCFTFSFVEKSMVGKKKNPESTLFSRQMRKTIPYHSKPMIKMRKKWPVCHPKSPKINTSIT